MNEQVIINRVTTVEVTLSRELLKPTESHTSQTNTAEIVFNKLLLLQVIPKTNFTVVGEDCLEIDPPTRGNPRLHHFDLRATHIGKGEVWIVVRQGQIPLSTIKLQPEIIHSRTEIRRVQKTNIDRDLNFNSNLNEPPNQLTIIERRNGQEIRYDYEFRSMSLNILNRYESKPITSERYEYVENLYKEIENRWLSTQDDVDLFSDELRAFGGQLFDRLFPEELQKSLWEHHSTINSIMVISTEPFIPWELVHLKPPGQKNLPDETKFLGQMGLVRWLYDAGWPPESIQIRNQQVYCIIPQYPIAKYQLPEAKQECKLLIDNFQAVLVEPQQKPVLELIKAGQFDLLHFAGHGLVNLKNMTSSKLMLEGRLEGKNYIKNYLNSTIVEQFFHLEQDENRPMVVLNACQVGQSSYALTGMSGFAQAFLKGGAGAFAAPLWSVGDRPARIFIESLYRALLNGLNLSEATRLARNTAKQTGDATWLSYSVYGNPHLRFITTQERAELKEFERLSLKGLNKEEGASLLRELGIKGELSAFSELVDGHPLLLKIVANLIKDEYPQDPNLERLADLGLGNLRNLLTDPRVLVQHRRENVCMVLVLDASFERLEDWQKRWLQNVSVYRGSFDAEAGMAMLPQPDEFCPLPVEKREVEQQLRKLVKRSLLEEKLNHKRQFTFQPVVLEYVRYKAGEQTEAHQQAIAYYSSMAQEPPWQTLDDLKEYLEIFYHLCQLGEYAIADEILSDCNEFLYLRGYYSTIVELNQKLVQVWQPRDNEEKESLGWALTRLGGAYHSLGQFHNAIQSHKKSLNIDQEIGDRSGSGKALGNLGLAYYSLGDFHTAIDYHQQHLNIAQEKK